MEKDFDNWNTLKKKINEKNSDQQIYFKEREIWFCNFGVNIGSEHDGVNNSFERPVLIFKKFTQTVFLAIPLTRSKRTGSWYFDLTKDSTLVLNQLRVLDAKRLIRKVKTIDEMVYQEIKSGLINIL